jgi:hypothetical protein
MESISQFPPDSHVRVVVDQTWTNSYRFGSQHLRDCKGSTATYIGTVVENEDCDPPGTICITTGLSWYPIRCLLEAHIRSIDRV